MHRGEEQEAVHASSRAHGTLRSSIAQCDTTRPHMWEHASTQRALRVTGETEVELLPSQCVCVCV